MVVCVCVFGFVLGTIRYRAKCAAKYKCKNKHENQSHALCVCVVVVGFYQITCASSELCLNLDGGFDGGKSFNTRSQHKHHKSLFFLQSLWVGETSMVCVGVYVWTIQSTLAHNHIAYTNILTQRNTYPHIHTRRISRSPRQCVCVFGCVYTRCAYPCIRLRWVFHELFLAQWDMRFS